MIRAYVLAGGESSRMQREPGSHDIDKALLRMGDETLLERALRVVHQAVPGSDPAILCGTPDRCQRLSVYGRTVPDVTCGCGPVGALDAALQDAAGAEYVLLHPIDLPLLPSSLLIRFVATAIASGAAVAHMVTEGFAQPLPLLIRADAREVVRQALQNGALKLQPVLHAVADNPCTPGADGKSICTFEVSSLVSAVTASRAFVNVNTPADLEIARDLAGVPTEVARGASN
ncbi:molybdenum cofactor guanylyltransferase [Terriglobus roseus]|uniref:Molybdenum cofactor guanylyltransferase n=1 Tax=Terriglobus roseus TaxID=392734 RepID=A0A1H4J818_9BACT|nr:NTP transferase domain-containing protein [Terriglobus roseus]SEB42454.1 molybdenum cofactor guanylyltransferase [Terriglobus roseus]